MMLRARTIRHSASAYFQRDYAISPKLELPQTTSWSPAELEDKRVRIQRPSQHPHPFASSQNLSSGTSRSRRRALTALILLLFSCSVLLWVFRNAYTDFSSRILDIYSSPLSLLDLSDSESDRTLRPEHHRHAPKSSKSSKQKPKHAAEAEDQPDTRTRRWPPMVTKIPETRPDPSQLYAGLTPASVDAQFCAGASPCRILLPLWIGEQESRGRMHLSQVLHLARALNRTLVLPNVGKSRIGACGRWEFDVYYDVGTFVSGGSGGVETEEEERRKVRKVMLMDDFRTWLELRPVGPTAQVVFVDEAMREDSWDTEEDKTLISGNGLLDVQVDRDALDLDDQRLRKTRCLASKFSKLKQDHHAAVTVHIPFPEHQKPLPDGELFINSLMNPEVLEKSLLKDTLFNDPDVLVLSWDIRHFPFGPGTLEAVTVGQVNTGLDYSEKIHALSKRLVDPYQSYLAVHWRMETVPPAMLPDCAEALVDTLNTLLADPILGQDIKTVWLASDFPWPISSSSSITLDESMRLNDPQQDVFQDDSTEQNPLMQIDVSARRSNTFRAVSPDHIRAIEVVKGAFRPGGALHGLTLTGVSEELDRVRKESESGGGGGSMLEDDDEQDVLLEDPGVLGILDKIAAMRAAVFVSGAKRCGRVSTFTRQITDYRANAKGSTQRNVVEVFG